MRKSILFLISVFVMHFSAQAQSSYIDRENVGEKDLLILEEENLIDINGKKIGFIDFVFSKQMTIELKTQKGVDYLSEMILNDYIDPTYIVHSPKARNYGPYYSSLKVKEFKAYRLNGTDDKTEIETKSKFNPVKSVSIEEPYYGTYYDVIYQLNGLNVGDRIKINYSLEIPYDENLFKLASNRLFFNGNIKKKNYKLVLNHDEGLRMDIHFLNQAEPDTVYIENKTKFFEWNYAELEACLFEKGARAYKELPHIVFSILPLDFLYQLPNSFVEEFIPFYSIFSYYREEGFISMLASVSQGVNNKQYSQVRKFLNKQIESMPDSISRIEKLKRIHNLIALDFRFFDDKEYFKKRDTRNPRMGDYITKNSIRDIKRYDVYVFMLYELKLDYYSTYLADNRSAEISNHYFVPMAENDFLFSVLDENRVNFIYPKGSRYGYLFGELPFYFKETIGRLVHLSDYRAYEQPIDPKMRTIQMPNMKLISNQRKTNALVEVNTLDQVVFFKSRINLSGQYSTMTRGVYQFDVRDKTVNPLYNQKIWEMSARTTSQTCKVDLVSTEFPFNANVNCSYTSPDILQKEGDTLLIDLHAWFNHIIYPNMDTENRQLDFYPDFMGQDTYVYYLKFDKEVKLIEDFEEVQIKNTFGELSIKISQQDETSIKISSSFAITTDLVKAEKIKEVGVLFKNIESLNEHHLKVLVF